MEVKAWEEKVIIPTYKTSGPDKNPMFLEKRIYQGSSGTVYPHAVIDQVYDEKVDQEYLAVFLENDFIKIMILPELGGRIQMAYDKTNDYHFVYYNQVIKPALVGLTGPWISGGIEFNWPQHHRPSTFDPIDFTIEAHADGSKTVWVSEIEKMFHTKGMAGFKLYPESAYLEITGKLYNRTTLPQTFLWWANPAVAVDEHYQSVFPPDVTAVYDHGKRDVSLFPIAKGTYYKKDYAPGTDISWYKNIPVPTSFMAVGSDFDFVGGYHHQKQAGILHIANHHISPGKKQWTWGSGNFGQMWDKHLTDEDGPYIEIMTGVYTDNQPDFSWIMPNQEITFTQYFLPYKEIGYVKNATKDALVNLTFNGDTANVKVYATAIQDQANITLKLKGQILFSSQENLSPLKAFETTIKLPENYVEQDIELMVSNSAGEKLVVYSPIAVKDVDVSPEAAKPLVAPKAMKTNEELYMAGLHLEQYRHATYSAKDYYEEALKRDDTDIRNNNALGLYYFRRGQFAVSEKYFQSAVNTLTRHNPNPYDGEPLYHLGLSLLYQDKLNDAYDKFYKAAWNVAQQDNAYLQLAKIETIRNNWNEALQLVDRALIRNAHGFKARHLKTLLLRKLQRFDDAAKLAAETLSIDHFDFGSIYELSLIHQQNPAESQKWVEILKERLRDNAHSYIEIAIDYAACGRYEEAIALLLLCENKEQQPLYFYYLANYNARLGNREKAHQYLSKGFELGPDKVFPNRLEDIEILKFVTKENPQDDKAFYYLGNLWYDKRQYEEAINCWNASVSINPDFASVNRNLSIAYYNRDNNEEKALSFMEKAFFNDPTDARVLLELDQLHKRLNYSISYRLTFLEKYKALLLNRDDLYLEYLTLKNLNGDLDEALALLTSRKFHPWEGGEGKVSQQYVFAKVGLAKMAITQDDYTGAIKLLNDATVYPENLGEGKLYGTRENDIDYWLGVAYRHLGDQKNAEAYFTSASAGDMEPTAAIFYNDAQPDAIFYQGLAYRELKNNLAANEKFNSLIDYGKRHMDDNIKLDYFAVSLPDLMIFDDDLNKRNKVHCLYMAALGYTGLEENNLAEQSINEILMLDNGHLGVRAITNHTNSVKN
ncbi:DUF5107 domain-containing protein [Sphingobacteriaceae bacterium GW460-11-11-14-LB5]|nr:DUF5107 domain-containing protein [Sphingobacteriaceae bacterium GW460-11-11-14-LB5]